MHVYIKRLAGLNCVNNELSGSSTSGSNLLRDFWFYEIPTPIWVVFFSVKHALNDGTQIIKKKKKRKNYIKRK